MNEFKIILAVMWVVSLVGLVHICDRSAALRKEIDEMDTDQSLVLNYNYMLWLLDGFSMAVVTLALLVVILSGLLIYVFL